jgi:hypothetical protein
MHNQPQCAGGLTAPGAPANRLDLIMTNNKSEATGYEGHDPYAAQAAGIDYVRVRQGEIDRVAPTDQRFYDEGGWLPVSTPDNNGDVSYVPSTIGGNPGYHVGARRNGRHRVENLPPADHAFIQHPGGGDAVLSATGQRIPTYTDPGKPTRRFKVWATVAVIGICAAVAGGAVITKAVNDGDNAQHYTAPESAYLDALDDAKVPYTDANAAVTAAYAMCPMIDIGAVGEIEGYLTGMGFTRDEALAINAAAGSTICAGVR